MSIFETGKSYLWCPLGRYASIFILPHSGKGKKYIYEKESEKKKELPLPFPSFPVNYNHLSVKLLPHLHQHHSQSLLVSIPFSFLGPQ